MDRSKEMQKFNNSLAKSIFGVSLDDASGICVCVACKGDVNSFKNQLSAKEYSISGLCQKCQDEIWE